jgi:hypothetical protein
MGTNYAFSITYNGKEVVRQYGQTDGHPTTVIPYLHEFIHTPDNMNHLKRNLTKCRFGDSAISDELWLKIHNNVCTWTGWFTNRNEIDRLYHLGFSGHEIFEYILRNRTTRCHILDALIMKEADESTDISLWQARTNKTDSDGYFAAYNVDLDNEKICCDWMGHKMEFDFHDFPDAWVQQKFERYECGKDFKLADWNNFVYVITKKKNGEYHNRAFTDYNHAVQELNTLNCEANKWHIRKVRLPWVGRSLCYVSEGYKETYYGDIYACLEHAKYSSVWQENEEIARRYPHQCHISNMEIEDGRYDNVCHIQRIRVIKECK